MRRPRGSGRIYQPKGSSVWWIKFYRNGQPFRESTGTTDKRKATLALSQRLAEVARGKFLGPNIERIGVKELAEDFLRDDRINGKSSLNDAEARWRLHLLPFFGSLRASQVTSSLLNAYVDSLIIEPWSSFVEMGKMKNFRYRVLLGDASEIRRELATARGKQQQELEQSDDDCR
jgi:hypothetical protein